MSRFMNPAMRQLTDQLKYAPQQRKLADLERAEQFLAEVEPGRPYPYQMICQRITEFRPEQYPDLVVSSEELENDLRLLIDELSASAELPLEEASEPVLTIEQVSKKYNISTKTVGRWRARGLVARRFLVDGRRRVGFLRSSVERFVNAHQSQVDRGSRFSQLNDDERDRIIRRAKRMARVTTATLSEVSRRIARRLNRSIETIRYTIKNYDKDHPDCPVFGLSRGILDVDMKNQIFASYRQGMNVGDLADRYHRTRSTVYRIVNEMRADNLLSRPIDYMHHESFEAPNAADVILAPEPAAESSKPARAPSGLPPYLQSLYEVPLLSREQEYHLFRKMNYLYFLARKERDAIDPHRVKSSQLDDLERLLDQAGEVKRRLVRANLRLVVSIAKRHVGMSDNLFELISDGNISLIRAVEKFDFSRGFKFSTYASWAVMKNYARTIPAEHTRRDRFLTGQELAFELTPDGRGDERETESTHVRMQGAVGKILHRLDDRERKIIVRRYGLDQGAEPETLEQVGHHFGVTKERIRQIEARAINKLRRYANEEKLEAAFFN